MKGTHYAEGSDEYKTLRAHLQNYSKAAIDAAKS
jgi:hypothetical protein